MDSRRQFNETGAQPISLSDIISIGKLIVVFDDDEEGLADFIAVYSTVESAILKDLADERKREMERIKAKQKLNRH